MEIAKIQCPNCGSKDNDGVRHIDDNETGKVLCHSCYQAFKIKKIVMYQYIFEEQ